jgi:hypothetical protein
MKCQFILIRHPFMPFMMQVQNLLSTKATGSEDMRVTNVD